MKVCFVLGAGASLANAVHFHKQRIESKNPPLDTTFFEKIRALRLTVPRELRVYASGLLGVDPFATSVAGLRMEEFFKNLFYDFLQERRSDSNIVVAYQQLVRTYVAALRQTTDWMCKDNRKGGPVGRLIAAGADYSDDVTIITFNQDLVIENELVKRARLRRRWCLDEGYGTFAAGKDFTHPRAGELFPAHGADCDHSSPIVVLKLHGSLNWYVRIAGTSPKPSVLKGGTGGRDVCITRRRSLPERLTYTLPKTKKRGRKLWYTWPVIIPPVYSKHSLIEAFMPSVWTDARAAIQRADRLVFFGYSLPPTDVEAELLFRRGITTNKSLAWVDVVNPDPASAHRFAAIASPLPTRWYPTTDRLIAEAWAE